jgi:hypothetical protein
VPESRWSGGPLAVATLADLLPPDQREMFLAMKASPAEPSISKPVPMQAGEENPDVDISEHLSKTELAALFAAYDEDDWVQVNDLLNTAEKRYGDSSMESKVEKTPKEAAGAERLKAYWSIGGVGGAKIRWGQRNAWYRCVTQTSKYLGDRAKGFCSNLALRNTGERPHPYPGGPNAASRAAAAQADAAQAAGILKTGKSLESDEDEKGHRARREGTAPGSHRERRAGRVPGSQLVVPFPDSPEVVHAPTATVQVDPPVTQQMSPGVPFASHRGRRGRPHGLTGSSKDFDPLKHPRSKDGEFIDIGAFVQIDKDTIGRVDKVNSDGTLHVNLHAGKKGERDNIDPKTVSVIPVAKHENPPATWIPKTGDRVKLPDGALGTISTADDKVSGAYVIRDDQGKSSIESHDDLTHVDSEGIPVGDVIGKIGEGVPLAPVIVKPKPKPKPKRAPVKAAMKSQISINKAMYEFKGPDFAYGFDGKFDPGNLSPDEAEAVKNQIKVEMTDIPDLKETVSEIKVIPHDTDDPAGTDILGCTMGSSVHLYSEPLNFDETENVSYADLKKWSSTGYATNVDKARTTLVHEMGHAVAFRMSPEGRGEAYAVLFKDPNYNGGKDLPNGSHRMNSRAIARDLSQYGASSPEEMLAESWAEYRLSKKPRPIAAKIGKIMEQHMNDDPAPNPSRIMWPKIDKYGDEIADNDEDSDPDGIDDRDSGDN